MLVGATVILQYPDVLATSGRHHIGKVDSRIVDSASLEFAYVCVSKNGIEQFGLFDSINSNSQVFYERERRCQWYVLVSIVT